MCKCITGKTSDGEVVGFMEQNQLWSFLNPQLERQDLKSTLTSSRSNCSWNWEGSREKWQHTQRADIPQFPERGAWNADMIWGHGIQQPFQGSIDRSFVKPVRLLRSFSCKDKWWRNTFSLVFYITPCNHPMTSKTWIIQNNILNKLHTQKRCIILCRSCN